MQKIAITASYGNFYVSKKATKWMAERGNKRAIAELKEREDRYWHGHGWSDEFKLGYDNDDSRADQDLIAAIEHFGGAKINDYPVLKIVEIPDDVEWYIEHRDGRESVHENHRVWE